MTAPQTPPIASSGEAPIDAIAKAVCLHHFGLKWEHAERQSYDDIRGMVRTMLNAPTVDPRAPCRFPACNGQYRSQLRGRNQCDGCGDILTNSEIAALAPADGHVVVPKASLERVQLYIAELLMALQPFASAAETADAENAAREPNGVRVYPWNYVQHSHFVDAFAIYSDRLNPDDWDALATLTDPQAPKAQGGAANGPPRMSESK